ncbi:MAG: aspartate carbamoyltransferase [Candidatus Shapirobacteria bacterium]|nr:aspartate carbamoyltransferase [Candidatus Shapirobacteria bacterium]
MNVLSVDQFSKETLDKLFIKVSDFKQKYQTKEGRDHLFRLQFGKQMCSFFFEPSTRTRISFELAARRLGMGVVTVEDAKNSSTVKGETLEDTIKIVNLYNFDLVVMRHNETGSLARAAQVSKIPIISGGDGKGEHPTQALLDVFTIWERFGRLDNLNVTIGGDLANGRTVRSLANLLSIYDGNTINFVSSPQLKVGDDVKEKLKQDGTGFKETDNVDSVLGESDVIYWTRIQKERMENPEEIGAKYVIDQSKLKIIPEDAIIMHPLPRVDEITTDVDNDKRAYYFQQAENGLYLRMALIDSVLNGEI